MNGDRSKYRAADGTLLTSAEIARLDEVEARLGNSDDIPEISDAAWATAMRGKHAKAATEAISIQLDAEVVRWLRRKGPEYQSEVNRILREKMLSEA